MYPRMPEASSAAKSGITDDRARAGSRRSRKIVFLRIIVLMLTAGCAVVKHHAFNVGYHDIVCLVVNYLATVNLIMSVLVIDYNEVNPNLASRRKLHSVTVELQLAACLAPVVGGYASHTAFNILA